MNMISPVADVDALCRKAIQFLDAGRPGAARPLVAAARALKADPAQIALLEVRLALADDNAEQALALLDPAITAAPQDARLRICRAEVRQRLGDWPGAADDAAEAVTLDPANPEAKARLGTALLELGHLTDAIVCLDEALAAAPALTFCRAALARALELTGNIDTALRVLIDGIRLRPGQTALINASITMVIRCRDFAAAAELAQQARTSGSANAETFVLMGHALTRLDRHQDAALAWQEALKLAPEDPHIRHLARGTSPSGAMTRTPAAFVRQAFDQYAAHYDRHARNVEYAVPTIIASAIARHPVLSAGNHLGPVLDLGCGTGLAANALQEHRLAPITGIDIAPAMLAEARAKHLYADLVEADIIDFLATSETQWPVIIAADALCYFGGLTDLLSNIRQGLTPDGWFIFSIETLLPDHDGSVPGNGSWALQPEGR
ncbi:MAG TPA: methyltransferase domain-containing protein, partial [Rhodopila sp.]|nr:methyltransferase domain-containing protein [Rhodopila sp.]